MEQNVLGIRVNRLVRYFIISDLIFLAGLGVISPIFSIFIIEKIPAATLVTVGIAQAIYWILKSIIQLPLANFLDRTPGEKDDFYVLIAGLIITSFTLFSFVFARTIAAIYFIEALHAVGLAFYVVSWQAIFSRHLDKQRISFDWALDSTSVGISMGISGLLGGIIATWFGFYSVFAVAGILAGMAALVLVSVPDIVLPKAMRSEPVIKDHKSI